jgi:NAD(P)H-dependent FMN reductase
VTTLGIVIATTRPGRVGLPIGRWVAGRAEAHGGFDEVRFLDLAEFALPVFDEPHHPRLGTYTKPHTLAWSAAVDAVDCLVFVTAEYNHSLPASLKNAIDYLSAEWADKALGIVSYGGIAAGTRAAQSIKPIAAALKMVVTVDAVALPMVSGQVVDGEFVATDANNAAADLMFTEMLRLEQGLSALRAARRSAAG